MKVHEAPLENRFCNGGSSTFTCTGLLYIYIYGNILVPLQVATWAKKQKNAEQIPVQSPFCIKLAPRKCFATEYVPPFRIMFKQGGLTPVQRTLSK